jgi:hypothetical protein
VDGDVAEDHEPVSDPDAHVAREMAGRLESDDAGTEFGLALHRGRPGQRPSALLREGDALTVRDELHVWKRRAPADVVDVDVREEDRVRLGAEPFELTGEPPLGLGQDVAAGRTDRGVHEDRAVGGSDQERAERKHPAVAVEELGGPLAPRCPDALVGTGEGLGIRRE